MEVVSNVSPVAEWATQTLEAKVGRIPGFRVVPCVSAATTREGELMN